MRIDEFLVETWMTEHENNCKYNLTDTCVDCLSLSELENLIGPIDLNNIKLDYGPIAGSIKLRKEIAKLYRNQDIATITTTIGAINANELVMMELLEKGDRVIAITPSYQQIYSFPQSLGCQVDLIELKEEDHWQFDIEKFKSLSTPSTPKTKLVTLISPNNPTGTYIEPEVMKEIISICKKNNIYILVDEVYRDRNSMSFNDIDSDVIVTSSLSKIYSCAGVRMGWIKGPASFIEKINYRRDYHVICNGPLNDEIAYQVLKNKEKILGRSEAIIKENKDYLRKWLEKEPLISCVIPKHGTVGFLKYDLNIDSYDFCNKLLEETGIFFVPGNCFECDHHLRFGFGNNPKIVKEGLAVFSKWLHESPINK